MDNTEKCKAIFNHIQEAMVIANELGNEKIFSLLLETGYKIADILDKGEDLAISQSQIVNAQTLTPPTETGEWVAITSCLNKDIHIICSHCKEEFIGKSTLEEWKEEYLFCHRCGAKMS